MTLFIFWKRTIILGNIYLKINLRNTLHTTKNGPKQLNELTEYGTYKQRIQKCTIQMRHVFEKLCLILKCRNELFFLN